MTQIRKKLVIVGDGDCGKTCLLMVFSKDQFPEVHIPTIFETYVTDIQVDGKEVCLYHFQFIFFLLSIVNCIRQPILYIAYIILELVYLFLNV